MTNLKDSNDTVSPLSFTEFPEDVQLTILSFLTPSEITNFACTSKRFVSLCQNDTKLWFTMCHRRWGPKTHINKWVKGKVTFKLLYRTLHDWDNLIGFWRRSGNQGTTTAAATPSLVFFEWGPSFISGSRVSPSKTGTYDVIKSPFLWMSLSSEGQVVNYLDPSGRVDLNSDLFEFGLGFGFSENELIPVNVSFMGKTHFIVEENLNVVCSSSYEQRMHEFSRSSSGVNLGGDDGFGVGENVSGIGSSGSLPDRVVTEIYQRFANRTSPGSDKSRKQRRKEKERLARRKFEPEHFVKIVNCSPTPLRPLQGLWKGICHDLSLAFYLVAYDDIGGIACRLVGDYPDYFSSYAPVFWTSKAKFLESPFSMEEESLYDSRIHLRPLQAVNEIYEQFPFSDDEVVNQIQQFHLSHNEVVHRILHVSSHYDLVIPELGGTINQRNTKGRIWQYLSGTFGFGFVHDNFVIDMKHIIHDGCILDAVKPSAN
ncbi:hypothetical protein TanjilG_24509 [Lupinus angustifolius]|uniref:F-box protein n=1 Tax=Lupinus angustifolius TaxID=3871 RepID=A0A394D827_LUPAN|nr:PREDICTED: F-box protein At3g12350-like [Lupinus angustifolius]OIW19810.1 hypothetical protein TanjilG_24509 [Lupinus angustifolius]